VRRIISLVSAATLTMSAALAAIALPAQAVQGDWTYVGAAGATQVNALGTTITSGITASSNLAGSEYPAVKATSAAAVAVPHVLNVAALSSGEVASEIPGGYEIASRAQVAGVNLLDGLITADALDTTATARIVDGIGGGGVITKLVHLTIGGALIPVDTAPNTTINLGSLAKVVINESVRDPLPFNQVRVHGAALHVTLLKPSNGMPAGAEIWVNPTMAMLVPTVHTDAKIVGGYTFGVTATTVVGSSVKVLVQPAGELDVPPYGTGGATLSNNVAGVKVPNIATVGAVTTTMNAVATPTIADVTTTAEIAKVNLLNGLITADAIDVRSHQFRGGEFSENTARLNFVRLTIGGKPIAVNVAKNSTINVLSIAKIVLNAQTFTANGNTIDALRITLLKPYGNLPIGAVIRVAAASTYVQ
jgi:hypothetical protein